MTCLAEPSDRSVFFSRYLPLLAARKNSATTRRVVQNQRVSSLPRLLWLVRGQQMESRRPQWPLLVLLQGFVDPMVP